MKKEFIQSFIGLCLVSFVVYSCDHILGVNCSQVCDEVKQLYVLDNELVPKHLPSSDSLICQKANQLNCCSHFESLLQERAYTDLKSMVSAVILPFNTIVNNSETQIKQLLKQILNETHNRTNARFEDQRLKETNTRLFSHLWSVVLEGVSQRRVEQYVNQFFNALFITEYEKEKRKQFSGEFASCLSSVWTEYSAFGHIPQTMSFQLQRAVESSSLLLRSLSLLLEVINATKHYEPNQDCVKELVKASYCSHCSGHLNARPCRTFCQNVIRGCLSQLSELDIQWQRFINSWQHFSASLVADRNPQTVFFSIDGFIDDAIYSLKSKTHETSKKVKVACGHPKRYLRNVMTSSSVSESTIESHEQTTSFFVRLQTFAHQLSKTKDLFSSLSDNMCNEYKEDNCWNGHSIGQYTQPLVPFGKDIEKTSSIVNLTERAESLIISSLPQKLKKMSQIMESYVTPHALSSQEFMNDEDSSGSGEGHADDFIDDEDYGEHGSAGSGREALPESLPESTTSKDPHFTFLDVLDNRSGSGGADSSFTCIAPSLLLLLFVTLIAFGKCHSIMFSIKL